MDSSIPQPDRHDKVSRLRVVASDEGVFVEQAPLFPAGKYGAFGGRARRFRVHGTYKLRVEWIVRVPDDQAADGHRLVHLYRYYNVRLDRHGRVTAGAHSDYYREWVLVARRRPTRGGLSPSVFNGALCEVEVTTVTLDRHQRPLPEHAQYSKVARIVEHKAGGGR
jgi:hypothetical protein